MKAAPFKPESAVQLLLPPSEYRHVALKTRELQALAVHVDDLSPFMFEGQSYELAHKRIAPGVYRAWLKVRS